MSKFGFRGFMMKENYWYKQILPLKFSFGIQYWSLYWLKVSANFGFGFGFGIGPKPKYVVVSVVHYYYLVTVLNGLR